MKICILSTRLSGTDGVSLEVEKWSLILQKMGHQLAYCAGQLGGYAAEGTLIPKLFFNHPHILAQTERAFNPLTTPAQAQAQVKALLQDSSCVQAMVDKNYVLATDHFSYRTLKNKLQSLLDN